MKILVINCGSSSLKYQLLDMTDESVLCKGSIERIGLKINGGEENVIVKVGDEKFVYDKELKDHVAANMRLKFARKLQLARKQIKQTATNIQGGR